MRRTIRGKIELPPGQRAARLLMHVPAGLITCLAVYIHWSLVLAFFGAFTIYEINEDQHIEDRAFHDILGFLAGLGAGIVVLFCLGVLEIWKIQG
ncbi:unnamed protein product [marine sediment metagenome]|uniref:Uncharacterized protein n=1 Tax=marine sediment metagenome TaxID=412755 RepID=X1V5Z6_9ZZZZ